MTMYDYLPSMFRNSNIVTAAIQSELSDVAGSIVYLPEGQHRINATVGGKAKTVDVLVDSRVAASFAEDLNKRFESNVRPFAGFDHKQGAASFIPKEFRYEEGVGLVLDVEWTEAGRKAVEGRDYSYFSPTFLLSKDGIPTGLAKRGEIGSLVNDPAFEEIPRIAASHNEQNNMTEQLIELGLVEASESPDTALETAKANLAALRESASLAEQVEAANEGKKSAEEQLAEMEAAYAALKAEYEDMKKKIEEKDMASAESAIDEAVKSGRIAPQDEDAKAFWKSAILADKKAAKVLASLPSNEAITGATILAGRVEETPSVELTGLARVEAAFKAQSLNK
jgi:phage I-like protein